MKPMKLVLKYDIYGFWQLTPFLLDICDVDSLSNYKEIDDFTKKFTLEEIVQSAKRSNMVFPDSQNCRLIIIYEDLENSRIREYKAYTKDDSDFLEFDELEFLKQNITNKDIINQLKNSFTCKNYISEKLLDFIMNINTISIDEIGQKYEELDYDSKRSLKEYIFERIVPRLEKNKLQRKR